MPSLISVSRLLILILLTHVLIIPVFSQAGSNDSTFNPGTGTNDQVRNITLQSDGKIIIAGPFTEYNGTPRKYIARLNSNGSLDGSFNTGAGTDEVITATAIQNDGKIIIGGDFTTFDGTSKNHIARLNSDGTLDASFNSGSEADGRVFSITIQNDGKILIGGIFTSYNGTPIKYIARLHADGTIDGSFTSPAIGANGIIREITVQSDSKILVIGRLNSMAIPSNNIIRLNPDGTLDTSFDTAGSGVSLNGGVRTLAIQSDEKIIVGGFFNMAAGAARNSLARLNTDGRLDLTFNTGTGPNSNLYITHIQNDGKIIIGCCFTNYNGTPIRSLARLNTDGTLDRTFNPGSSTGGGIFHSAMQNDGKLIIGGNFTTYNGSVRNNIARVNLMPQPIADPIDLVNLSGDHAACGNNLYWHTTNEISIKKFIVEKSNDGVVFSGIDSVNIKGGMQNSYVFTDIHISAGDEANTFYRLKVVNINGGFIYSNILKLSVDKRQVLMYPSPAKDFITITLNDCMKNKNGILTNLLGQKLQSIKIVSPSFPLNLSRYQRGIYFFKIDGIKTIKILKE